MSPAPKAPSGVPIARLALRRVAVPAGPPRVFPFFVDMAARARVDRQGPGPAAAGQR